MKRDIQPVLAGMLSDPGQSDVVLVEGARQVGKSTD
jgi:predicted AAA+ superfamily ATPase